MSAISRLKVAIFGVLLATLFVPGVQAATIAVNFDNTTGSTLGNPPFTLGWSFTAVNDITVTDLGLFDADQDGLSDRYNIGLWDSGGNLLVSTTLPAGTTAPLDDKFRFESVAGTNLFAGQNYFIGALFTTGNDGLLGPGGFGTVTGFTTSSDILFLEAQFASGGSLTFPGSSGGTELGYFGPNFRFDETTPVPEPASLLLLGTGLVPLARRAYRRRYPR